jgi:hypothetical protein
MDISVRWSKPMQLKDGRKQNLIYSLDELNMISEKAGIYVFARRFGNTMIPLYIGQALNLRRRIEQQLNNVQLMMGVKNALSGKRLLLLTKLELLPGQNKSKVLNIVEHALIKSALGLGYEIININGTQTRVHRIKSNGKKKYHIPFARKMNIER